MPWLVPLVLPVQVALVAMGVYRAGTAVLVGIALELVLWSFALTRVIAGWRRYRATRAAGGDIWRALEDTLAVLVPRRLARWLLLDPRLFGCLAGWLLRRHRRIPGGYGYSSQSTRILFGTFIGLLALEGGLTDLVLRLLLPGTPWPWLATLVDGYALLWLAGIAAAVPMRPHLLTATQLRVRDGVFHELVVARAAIRAARPVSSDRGGLRSGIRRDGDDLLVAYGAPTVRLALDPRLPPVLDGRPADPPPRTLTITVADPQRFLADLGERPTDLVHNGRRTGVG